MELNKLHSESRETILKLVTEIKEDVTFQALRKYAQHYNLKPAQLIHWLSLAAANDNESVTYHVYSNTKAIELLMNHFRKKAFDKSIQNDLYDIWLSFSLSEHLERGQQLKQAFGLIGVSDEPFKYANEFGDWENGVKTLPNSTDPSYNTLKTARRRAKAHFLARLNSYIDILKVELENAGEADKKAALDRIETANQRLKEINTKYNW